MIEVVSKMILTDLIKLFKEGFYKSNFENTYGVKQGISKTVKKGGKWVLADPEASSRLNRENFKEAGKRK